MPKLHKHTYIPIWGSDKKAEWERAIEEFAMKFLLADGIMWEAICTMRRGDNEQNENRWQWSYNSKITKSMGVDKRKVKKQEMNVI